jgi:hypothetical protein
MTTIYVSSNVISSATNTPDYLLAQYTTLVVAPNVDVVSQNYDCIDTTSGGVSIINSGQIYGNYTAIANTYANTYSQMTITNEAGGSIIGGNSAIYIGINAFSIANYGSIANSSYSNFAIQTSGTGTFLNYGSLAGGYFDTANSSQHLYFYNAGTISGIPSATSQDAFDGVDGSGQETLMNVGSMFGNVTMSNGAGDILDNEGHMAGSVSMGANTSNLVHNGGTMDATGVSGTGFTLVDSVLDNVGLMYQSLSTASPVNMITFADHAGDYFRNSGVVAEIHGAAGSNAVAFGNGGGDVLDNEASGVIYGNVSFGSGAGDSMVNDGAIYGNVTLGNGAADAYYGQKGHLYGNVVCGSGGDYVYSGSGYETATAGLGNDVFYAGAGGGLVINETAAAQHANELDTVANFQVATGVAGQGTYLHFDASMASSTFFMSDGHSGTWIAMSLGGGNYSFIDVLGAGVSTVQSQSYFA